MGQKQICQVAEVYGLRLDETTPEAVLSYGGDGSFLYAEQKYPKIPKVAVRKSKRCVVCHDAPLDHTMDLLQKGKLKENKISRTERELYQTDLDRNLEVIESRKGQIESFLASAPAETKAVDRTKAHETEQLVEDLASDLREDFFSIFRKYAELNKGRTELHKLSTNLEARKKWLKDYDRKKP